MTTNCRPDSSQRKATARPLISPVQKALTGVAGLVPLAGLAAAWLWRLFEPAARAVLGPAGTEVRVVEIRGTRVVVEPLESQAPPGAAEQED